MFDMVIEGGTVLEGTGKASQRVDLGIEGDRIRCVEADLKKAETRIRLDATSRIVCPGFIDVHSHSDVYLLIEPSAPSKITQGITTEIVGNCGASAAPLRGSYRLPSDWRNKPIPGEWSSVAEYRTLIEQARPAVNVALLVGHNTLRAGVAGYDNRPVTQAELDELARLLDCSLAEGARGLSTGLLYAPGLFASREEITVLTRVVAKRQGLYTTHMRSESSRLLDAIQETIDIARDAGCRAEISHLKTSGKRNWGLLEPALEMIHKAQSSGLELAADRYPYTAAGTDLDVIFPAWASEGGQACGLARLHNKEDRLRLRADLLQDRSEDYWSTICIGSTTHPDNHRFQGLSLPEVARALGVEPVDAVLHLAKTDELKTGAFFFGMSEDNMRTILAEPYVMLGSDASLRAPTGPLSQDYPHPRAYGSYPRFLRMSLDGKTVPLPEAIRKMTSLAADHFRIRDRGRIAPNMFADVVIFDPARIRDLATYDHPHQFAEGIDAVVVNGKLTQGPGGGLLHRAGRFLAD